MTTDGRLARGKSRRNLLLDAAVNVVAERGSGALTHRAVAAAADVSVASVTYHFPTIVELRQAMFDHAGSRIGLAFVSAIEAASSDVADIPEIAAAFSASLVGERRVDTTAVFEMIIAAGHDPSLRPLVQFFNDRLADLLARYTGNRFSALTITAAIQGLILTDLARSDSEVPNGLHIAVADLIRRFRATGAADMTEYSNHL